MADLYKQAGVDIEAGEKIASKIGLLADKVKRTEVLDGIGGFAGLFKPDLSKYKEPVLVSATDGVGTKLKIAQTLNKHETIGVDLVAMCVNDIITTGAEPLFFLDYISIGKVKDVKIHSIISGIVEGCRLSGCSLLGGETAEHPGVMPEDDYDLAGFAVGIVDKEIILGPERVKEGDSIIGIASSGVHSNGFSLIRKLIADNNLDLNKTYSGMPKTLGEELLTPTKIYVQVMREILKDADIKAAAHITGGGITKNLPRVFPDGLIPELENGSWQVPAIFDFIQELSGSNSGDMFETFNIGIGLAVICARDEEKKVLQAIGRAGEKAWQIGSVVKEKDLKWLYP